MLRRTMSSIFPNSLSLFHPEHVKTKNYAELSQDAVEHSSNISALLAIKKVDKRAPVIQQSFLIGSLLEQLCALYETDKVKSRKLYFELCEQLSKWGIISPVAYLEEFRSVHTQYKKALYNIIQSSLVSMGTKSASLSAMLNATGDGVNVEPIVIDHRKVFDFEMSRYLHEFTELGKLGSGGYGNVYRVQSKLDGQEYAIKKIPLQDTFVIDRNESLLREVRILAGLRHKNVVQYHSAWIEHENESISRSEDRDEGSSLESDGIVPYSARKPLPHADSFLLESSDDDAKSYLELESGSFGLFSPNSLPYDGDKNPKTQVSSKFWGESSASEPSSSMINDMKKIRFTISSQESDSEPLFNDPIASEHSGNSRTHPCSPPKEVIRTHGVLRDMGRSMPKVKSFIIPKDKAKLTTMLKSVRNHSFSAIERSSYRNENKSTDTLSEEAINFPKESLARKKLVLYMQMQLCQTSLKHWLSVRNKSISNGKKFFHESVSFLIMKQIAAALLFIHSRNLIHRDVKPPNIFVNDCDNPHILLGDFGLAKRDSEYPLKPEKFVPQSNGLGLRRLKSHTSGVGTTTYAAPEQLAGDLYDAKADMYSFGIVIYELWTPFTTAMERARQIKLLREHHVPNEFILKHSEIGKLVTSLLDHDPGVRPSSTDLFENDFFEKSKDKVIEEQLQRIVSLEKQVEELKRANKSLSKMLEARQLP